MHLFNTELGKIVDIPEDDKARAKLIRQNYGFVEKLVDTARGQVMLISVEEQVQSGGAVGALLGKKRRDEGHEGQVAFMRPAEWDRLPDSARKAFIKAPPEVDPTLAPKGQHLEMLALQTAQIVAQGEQLRAMQAKLDALGKK